MATASLKNRALIALVTIVAALFGSLALTSLRQELIPSIQFPQLAIITQYPGASPEIVSESVSDPMEQSLRGLSGVESTSSTSSSGQSLVAVTFAYGTDLAAAENRVSALINRLGSVLPPDSDPQVLAGTIDDLPIIQLAVSGPDTAALVDRLEQLAVPPLEELDGVRGVALSGAPGQRVSIEPDQAALTARGLTTADIRDAVSGGGSLIPAGEITEGEQTFSVQSGTTLTSAEDIAALPLVGASPAATIGDVAAVALADDPVTSISRVDGRPAVTLAITKLPDANTVEVSHLVNEALDGIRADLGDDVEVSTVFDQAPFIEESIEALATEGALGLLFAVVVILLFLFSVRATLVTAISIPTSLLITFIAMQAAGYTLNILTLAALTISIGRVVDDSIVVIENIKRHLSIEHTDRVATVARAVREVAAAITASTVTSAAVFLPITFVGDTVGELFRPFALTASIALAASLVVSLTIVPVLAYWFLRTPASGKRAAAVGEAGEEITRMQRAYQPFLRRTIGRPVVTVLVSALVFGGSLALIPLMSFNFLGDSGQNTISVTEEFEPGTSLAARDAAASRAEEALDGIDGIETVQTTVGGGGLFGGGGDSASYSITTSVDADSAAIQDEIRDSLGALDGAGEFVVGQSSGFGGSSTIDVDIEASTQADLEVAAADVLAEVRGLDEVSEATSSLQAAQPYIEIAVDRAAAAEAGFTETALAGFVAQATQPSNIGSISSEDRTISVYLVPGSIPTTRDELAALPVPTASGIVRLDSLASVADTTGPATLTAVDGARSATVSATPSVEDLSSATAALNAALERVDLPAGVTVEVGGVSADQADAFGQLGLAMLVAILIVYVVMVATFKSLLQPLLLLVSVPFAATGALLLQVITGIPLGISSLIGLLMLIGIVVTNAIVLVDLVNQYRERGLKVREAIIEGASRRLRPILMTAAATVFALLPMASGLTGGSGFISQPLALVVIGGLVSSTVLTLIVLPALYMLVEGTRERRMDRRAEGGRAASVRDRGTPVE